MSHIPLPNLDVGKYAGFVWPAYGLSAAALLAMLVDSLLRARRWRREAESERASEAPDAEGQP